MGKCSCGHAWLGLEARGGAPAGGGGGYSNLYLNSIKIDYFKKLFLIVIKTPQAEPGGLRQWLAPWALRTARRAPRTSGTSGSRGHSLAVKERRGCIKGWVGLPQRGGASPALYDPVCPAHGMLASLLHTGRRLGMLPFRFHQHLPSFAHGGSQQG